MLGPYLKTGNGMANIVSFIDYLSGPRQGYYFPNPIPSYLLKNQSQAATTIRPADVMKDELFIFLLMTAVTSFGGRSSSRLLLSIVKIKRCELITETEVPDVNTLRG
jgi:hypothetical protein